MEMENEKIKVPILKKDCLVNVPVTYSESASIVQAIFTIASLWDKDEVEKFKNLIEKRERIEEPNMVVYLHLDKLYKKILSAAKEADMIEYTEVSNTIDPLMK